jgi:integrase/recombinase XerC/integrase/recombinase XerD
VARPKGGNLKGRHETNSGRTSRDKTDIVTLIHAFEVANKVLNKSPKTTAWYSNNLRLFKDFLQGGGYSLSIGDIGMQEVRDYVLYLKEKRRYSGHRLTPTRPEGLSPCTIRAHVETLKAFSSWLFEEGYTDSNKLERLKFPKVPRKYVEVLSAEEIRKIVSSIDTANPVGARNVAVVIILLDTGIRLAELVNLKCGDVHIEQGYLKVMGKGSRERVVPIGLSAQRVLLRYIHQARGATMKGDESLFLSTSGVPITINGVRLLLERLGKQSGVPRLHAHLCRHTFATNYLLNGGDVFSLQQILGHSSLDMVRRYVTLTSAQVTVQHRKFSPMDRMGLNSKGQHHLNGSETTVT